jgi:hypothetical protein
MVDRPRWTEIVGVLLVCAVVLAVLAHVDAESAREAGARVAPQPVAQVVPATPSHPRTQLALMLAGTGFALTAAGSVVLSRRRWA